MLQKLFVSCLAVSICAIVLSTVGAQQPVKKPGGAGTPKAGAAQSEEPLPGSQKPEPPESQKQLDERRPPAPEYAAALMATLGILVIVCKPLRRTTT